MVAVSSVSVQTERQIGRVYFSLAELTVAKYEETFFFLIWIINTCFTVNTFGYAIFNSNTHVPCEKAQLLNTCVFIHSLCIIKSTFASYFTQYVKNSFFASLLITDKKKESGLLLHVILKSDIIVFKRFNQYRNSSHSFRT